MKTYDDMYRALFSAAIDNKDSKMLSLLNEWFDLDGKVMPLTRGQVKRLVYLGDYIRNQYHALFA